MRRVEIKQAAAANKVICCLLFTLYLLLLSACPQEPPQTVIPAGSGMGTLSLYLDENVRSIMPITAVNDFAVYEFVFYEAGTSTVITVDGLVDRTNLTFKDPVYLYEGDYDLVVTAFMDNGKLEKAAIGRLDGINITDGISLELTVVLRPVIPDGIAQGTFSWDIEFNTVPALTKAEMTVSPLSPGGTPEKTYNFLDTSAPNYTDMDAYTLLNSGYYNVVFDLRKKDSNGNDTQPVIWRQVLHVYQNLISHFDYTFTDDHFNRIYYIVTFNYNYGTTLDGKESVEYNTAAAEPAGVQRTGYTLEGWYTDQNFAAGTKWDFGTDIVTGDITLYARWAANHTLDPGLVIDSCKPKLMIGSTTLQENDEVTIILGATNGSQSKTISIENFDSFEYGSVTWKVNGVELAGDIDEFEINTANAPFNTAGVRLLTVQCVSKEDGNPYSTTVRVRVI